MHFSILTIFPQFFSALDCSLVGKAQERGIIRVDVHNLRDWTSDVHHSVDDVPYGGGAGMVMRPQVWAAAVDSVRGAGKAVLAVPSPAGKPLRQNDLLRLSRARQIIIACGRYEGIDSRVTQYYAQQRDLEVFEYSLGDYVLNGGEVAAVALVEGVSRLLPKMVGNPDSLAEESHGAEGILEYPISTRPAVFRGIRVPEVLTSGKHGAVERWRRDEALRRTCRRRPDLIQNLSCARLGARDLEVLAEYGWFAGPGETRLCKTEFGKADFAGPGEARPGSLPAFSQMCASAADLGAQYVYTAVYEGKTVACAFVSAAGECVSPKNGEDGHSPACVLQPVFDPAWDTDRFRVGFTARSVRALRSEAENLAYSCLYLRVEKGNRDLQRYYRSLGFRQVRGIFPAAVSGNEGNHIAGGREKTDITMVFPLSVE